MPNKNCVKRDKEPVQHELYQTNKAVYMVVYGILLAAAVKTTYLLSCGQLACLKMCFYLEKNIAVLEEPELVF